MYRTLFLISSQKRKSALEEIMEVSLSKKVIMLQNWQTVFYLSDVDQKGLLSFY